MPDKIGTKTTRSDVPSTDESPMADAPEDAAAPAVEEEDANEESAEDSQGADDDEEQTAPLEDLKIVVSIKGVRAIIGVQQPSSDPHIETFDDQNLAGLTQELPAVIERARARWEDEPKYPAHERPDPPARRRNRSGQGTAQDATAGPEAEQAQQQTLRLF